MSMKVCEFMRMLKEEHHKERNLPKNRAKWSHLPLPPLLQSKQMATFSPQRPQSGPNKETMIRAMIQPFHTTLSRSAECQHKFADTHSSISAASPDALFLFICIIPVTLRLITLVWFAYLWLKLSTGVHTVNTVQQETSCCLWVWGDKDLQGGGWTWSILRFNPILTHTDIQCLQCTLQSPILC